METIAVKDIHFDLVEQCKKGNGKAQFKLYNLYKRAMYNVCLRMVNDEDEAHDVLQEAFVSAFGNLEKFEGRSSFGTWLKRIVVNKALSHLKSKAGWEKMEDDAQVPDVTDEADIDETAMKVDRIKSAVAQLPHGFRTVLSLYLFEGYDHKEIASIMGITESTSKTQYLRAKNKLLNTLNGTN